ncbi:hypothetical protein MN608_11707 [Microdochium nivale]|nr:hypothetical protein MN608_11707 [Microdochium nivale]
MARFNMSTCLRIVLREIRHWHIVLQALIVIVTFALMCHDFVTGARAELWRAGGKNGWNSDPSLRIYFYANHQEPPEIPLIWSQRLTDSNLAIAGLSLVLTAQRGILAYLCFDWTLFSIASDFLIAYFWYYSMTGQMSPDMTDFEHVSLRPWYLERRCSEGYAFQNACEIAQAAFAMSIISLTFYILRIAFCVLSHAYNSGRQRVLAQIHEKEIVRHRQEVVQHRRTKSYSRSSFDWVSALGNEASAPDDNRDIELGLRSLVASGTGRRG